MRLTISKRHHRQLLTALAEQLGSDNPTDALEHILNCWTALPSSSAPQHREAPMQNTSPPNDPLDGIVQF
jgi:hypothetical protein